MQALQPLDSSISFGPAMQSAIPLKLRNPIWFSLWLASQRAPQRVTKRADNLPVHLRLGALFAANKARRERGEKRQWRSIGKLRSRADESRCFHCFLGFSMRQKSTNEIYNAAALLDQWSRTRPHWRIYRTSFFFFFHVSFSIAVVPLLFSRLACTVSHRFTRWSTS